MSPHKPKAMFAASERQYTAAVRDSQVLRGGSLFAVPVMEGGARILMHVLLKLTQFYVSLVALWSQNGSFKHRKDVIFESIFVPILTYGHESLVMTEEVDSSARYGIFAKIPRWDTRTCRG